MDFFLKYETESIITVLVIIPVFFLFQYYNKLRIGGLINNCDDNRNDNFILSVNSKSAEQYKRIKLLLLKEVDFKEVEQLLEKELQESIDKTEKRETLEEAEDFELDYIKDENFNLLILFLLKTRIWYNLFFFDVYKRLIYFYKVYNNLRTFMERLLLDIINKFNYVTKKVLINILEQRLYISHFMKKKNITVRLGIIKIHCYTIIYI